jgi:hypothetical protein
MRVRAVLRRLYIWKELLLAAAIVLFNGVIVSNSGLLSYTHFTWAAYAQSYNLGAACVSPTQCLSGFCVDGVCCNQACTQPGQMCNAPGAPGICHSAVTAPALSSAGEALAVLVLIGGAYLGWRLRRTD